MLRKTGLGATYVEKLGCCRLTQGWMFVAWIDFCCHIVITEKNGILQGKSKVLQNEGQEKVPFAQPMARFSPHAQGSVPLSCSAVVAQQDILQADAARKVGQSRRHKCNRETKERSVRASYKTTLHLPQPSVNAWDFCFPTSLFA